MSEPRRKALIIGGGVGGLTAALALGQRGWEVDVFEQAPELREVGSGIMISPNAMSVLFGLGLERVVERGVTLSRVEMRTWEGRALVRERAEDVPGTDVPAVLFHRASLHGALHEALGAGIRVHLGARLSRFEEDGNGVVARFEDGREARGEVLVGADGLRSVVRAQLHPGEALRYAGHPCWRGLARGFSHPELPLGLLQETQGRGARFGVGHVREDLVYWWATADWPQGKAVPGGDKAFLGDLFRTAHAPLPELIAATRESDLLRNDLLDRLPLGQWGRGRVTLLGDAAHPMMPNMGQGACSAIEDGGVLALALERGAEPVEGLRRYERVRQARTRWLQQLSWRFGVIGQWRQPVGVWLREQSIRLAPASVLRRQYTRMWGWRLGADG
ncbi:FAD-dependent monooxygenase [Melittangium boletus]|uniref:FAD-dependent oxidoreductase n=1 Tax=Melittangium boletus DSM 14713 TaxID=1294270 RepID=A0A286NV83_9BACT|nr:FAD-dependent monooxygenase [Melittangium boletus]ATB27006.1 FAD-dependent oxidoreductase [Melittangium boletus DSM 14713]